MTTRDLILERGQELLLDAGLRALTTNAVAARARISKKTLYKHFAAKDEMVEAIVLSLVESELGMWDRILDADTPPMQRVQDSLRFVADAMPRLQQLLFGQVESFAPSLWRTIDARRIRRLRRLKGLMKELQDEGQIRPDVDADRWLLLLMTVTRHALHPKALSATEFTFPAMVETVIQLFYEALLTEKGRANASCEAHRRGAVDRLTRWVISHPVWVIAAAVGLTALFATVLPRLEIEVDFKGFLSSSDPAVLALERAEDRYGAQEILIVVVETQDTVFTIATLAKLYELERAIEALSGVDEVLGPTTAQIIIADGNLLRVTEAAETPPEDEAEIAALRQRLSESARLRDVVVSEAGDAAAILVRLEPDAERMDLAATIEALAAAERGPEEIHVAGLPSMHRAMAGSMFRDIRVLVPAVIAIVVAVLLISFRSLRVLAASLPIVLMSVVWALAAMVVAGQPFTPFALALPVMTIAIGIADAIHILNRFREERTREPDLRLAVFKTMRAMRAPVVMTSLTTAAGFLSIMSSLIEAQRMFGAFVALAVLVAMVLSLTFLPAVLVLAPPPLRAKRAEERFGRFLAACGRGIYRARYVLLALGVGAAALFVLAIPRIRVETIPQSFLGEGHSAVLAMDAVDRHFGGSLQLAVEIDTGRGDGLKDPELLHLMDEIAGRLESIDGVSRAVSLADLVRELNFVLHDNDPAYDVIPDDAQTVSQLLRVFEFRGGDLGQMATSSFASGEVTARIGLKSTGDLAGVQREVQGMLAGVATGDALEQVDVMRAFISLFEKMPRSQALSLLTSAVAAALIVAVLMRSIAAGIVCIVPLLFTVLASFGVMGYAGLPLDIATLRVASMAIGVGIDYAIHFTERHRRELASGRSSKEALEETLRTEGKAISYNALAVGLGFAVFFASSFRALANVGMLVSLTMFVSAVASFTIVPGLLVLWRRQITQR
ncbi:MAG: MMPL family transporter [Candidatus Bipolaricaulota bacterium]|nr:MAG: MMPL family transporter [Candidatus Bipolaricaulota bacterium]